MKKRRYILYLVLITLCVGCGTKKKMSDSSSAQTTPASTWHTCLIQGAHVTVNNDGNSLSAAITMQTVHDSMLIISVMPVLGIEMLRLEATPLQLTAIDKYHGQYAETTFAELNRKLTPTINWDILQQICTADLPTGSKKARLLYAMDDEQIEIIIDYPERKIDLPLRMNRLRLDRYTKIDITKWL